MALNPYLQLPPGPPPDEAPDEGVGDVRKQAAEMLKMSPVAPRAGAPGAPPGPNPIDAWLKDMTASLPQPQQPKEGMFAGTGRALAGGAAELGHQITGAAAWAGNQIAPGSAVAKGLNWANETAGQSAQDWQESLSPQDRDLMARQWTTLDPHQTIWQGSPHDFVHALSLQVAQATPATLSMLLPMTALIKAGMMGGALTYVGATQAGLSLGSISNNIGQEIGQLDDNTLRQQSPAFAQMLDKGMDPASARQELTQQAQRYAPVIGGLVSGGIAALAGRFLTPVMTGAAGAGLARRAGLGFLDQAAQGAGIGATDYIARETAAQTYDKGRAPDLVGAAKAAGESAAAQGVVGAGFAAVHGRSGPLRDNKAPNQPAPPEIHSTMANTPENKATGAATEEHVTAPQQTQFDFDTRQPPQPGELGPLEQGPAPPRGPPPGPGGQMDFGFQQPEPQQRELPLQQPPQADMFVRPDLASAVRSHYEGAAPAEPTPAVPNGMHEPNGPQGNLDLRGGQMNPPRPGPSVPVPAPAQLNLPLRQQVRGGPQIPPIAEPPRTRADDLRARAAGTQPDINQPDLFRDTQNPNTLTTRGNRPMLAGTPDHPSAEPFADIQAQLRDLSDPQHERGGVYLSADNVASLRQRGLLDQVREAAGPEAQPLINFDGKGGLLIAKDQQHADLYTHYRDQKVGNMQEILGEATGAGHGKPGTGELTVQQHDDHGNVTRESVVGSPQEAEELQRAYTDVARGRTAQILSTPAAILRRAQLIRMEHEQLARGGAEKGSQRAV